MVQQANGGEQTWLATLPLLVAYCFIPICTAVAILHYRLYDIEVIINRAVVLAVGTAFVAVGYVALVVGSVARSVRAPGLLAVAAGHRRRRAGVPTVA